MTSSRTARFALKLLTIACSGVLLTACGGSGGGSSSSASTPGTPGVIDSLSKTSIWYGPDAREGEAMAACTGCSDTNFSYRWVVDVNRDGQFDENPDSADVTIQGAKFEINAQTVARSVKLVASHPEAPKDAFRIYTPGSSQVVQTVRIGTYGGIAIKQDETAVAYGVQPFFRDIEKLENELTGVKEIVNGTVDNFIILKKDSSVLIFRNRGTLVAQSEALKTALAGGVQSVITEGPYSTALKNDGSVVLFDYQGRYFPLDTALQNALAGGVQSVIAEGSYSTALKNDGSVVLFNVQGNLIPLDTALQTALAGGVQSVIAEGPYSSALKNDGSVVLFNVQGNLIPLDTALQTALAGGVQSVIADGTSSRIALKNDGSVVLFNVQGNLIPLDTALQNALAGGVQSVIAEGSYSTALKNDGSVVLFNAQGNLIPLDTALQTALAGGVQSVIAEGPYSSALKNDGSVVLFNDQGNLIGPAPELAENLVNIVGFNDDFAIKKDGSFVSLSAFDSKQFVFAGVQEQEKPLNTN